MTGELGERTYLDRAPVYGRMPLLSVIHGCEMVKGVPVREAHLYAYSNEFNEYADDMAIEFTSGEMYMSSEIKQAKAREVHFFAHGVEMGIWYRALREQAEASG